MMLDPLEGEPLLEETEICQSFEEMKLGFYKAVPSV